MAAFAKALVRLAARSARPDWTLAVMATLIAAGIALRYFDQRLNSPGARDQPISSDWHGKHPRLSIDAAAVGTIKERPIAPRAVG